ncbi:MAG: DUF4189 domain-containing protein [Actinobacteria bacterium]|nr:DUF4189 domain-containing protein [Actinomycetota bacterium]MCB9424997.1 DUF4189 domain-containing protein [Actinomycetota bacterium]HRY11044.1 DUF4189 domain-containing protein [Candidatus Nanopelagicales bacterium]
MSGPLRSLIGGSILALALLLSLLIPTAGVAGTVSDQGSSSVSAVRRYYGALALSRADGAVGWSYDYRTKAKAGRAALRECKKASATPWSCRKIVWVRNGCVALAVRWNDNGTIARYAWGVARNKAPAYRKALNKCGYGCKRRAWTCTTR